MVVINVAIYSRKSKFTGKGESIENQIELCRNYAQSNLNAVQEDILIYEDEGFSGKNLDRPRFRQMMLDAQSGKIDCILCYKLDRISRNVGDFSNLLEELNKKEISFICIKEQFDTTTPMGRAMMYIASVFAQLERETIAERIRDNLYMLAKTGRWLGGKLPLGFISEKVEKITVDDKTRTAFTLKTNPDEKRIIRLIFAKFLELQSLSQLEKQLLADEIKSPSGAYFRKTSLKNILTHPVYCAADEASFEYFKTLGVQLYCEKSDLSGKHGYSTYSRTKTVGKGGQKRTPPEEWMLSVGSHEGFISSANWIKANKILSKNSRSSEERKIHNPLALFAGLLRCGHCGSTMRPKVNTYYKDSENQPFSYMCELKERSRKSKCDCKNISGNQLDAEIIDIIFSENIQDSFYSQIAKYKVTAKDKSDGLQEKTKILKNQIDEKESALKNYVTSLGQSARPYTMDFIEEEIERLGGEIEVLQIQYEKASAEMSAENNTLSEIEAAGTNIEILQKCFDSLTVPGKREYLQKIIEKVTWDGNEAHVYFKGMTDFINSDYTDNSVPLMRNSRPN